MFEYVPRMSYLYGMKAKEKDILEVIKNLDVNKYTYQEIAKMVNCNDKTVRLVFKKHKIAKNLIRREGRDKVTSVNLLIEKGFTQSQIANMLNTSSKNIINFCYNHDITNPNKSNNRNISDTTYQMLLGSMLGDGHISQGRLRLKHSIKQKDYMLYKARLITDLGFKIKEFNRFDSRTGKYYPAISLDSEVLQVIKNIEKEWYSDKKRIPESIRDIEPLGLAIWFMDDGYMAGKSVMFATQCFDINEIQMLQNVLKEKFNIETTLRKSKCIYVRLESYSTFYNLIKEHIIPSMQYKLPI